MEFLIFWALCGVVCAVVASNKGRNGCAWGLGGMLLGPIGIILILVTPASEQGLVKSGSLKKCPYCAEMIKAEAKVCRYCSRELEPVQVVVPAAGVPLQITAPAAVVPVPPTALPYMPEEQVLSFEPMTREEFGRTPKPHPLRRYAKKG